MFNSSVLDVAVGLAFVFLLVSTVCSSIREAIEHFLKTRASYLEYAIRELLRDPAGTKLAKDFFDHPMISGLFPGHYVSRSTARPTLWERGKNLPSYIPSRAFALALIDLAARGPATVRSESEPAQTTVASLRASVMAIENSYLQRLMLIALDSSQGSLEELQKSLESWYDGAMDRASGWYKRSTQLILFAVAIVVVVVANVDAVEIASRLYSDPALRAVTVSAAEKAQQYDASAALQTLHDLRLPIGWNGTWPDGGLREWLSLIPGLVRSHLVGWLLTAFAATLGAPFWFDILNRVMVIRSTVKPHEKSGEEGSEDRQPSASAPQPIVVQMPMGALQPMDALQPLSALQPLVAQQPPANTQHLHDEEDPCGEPITDFTRDEDLPPARGGVG